MNRQPVVAFAAALFGVGVLGSFFVAPSYRAGAMIAISDKQIQNEWDLMKDETRDVDLEEQIRSRAVLEPVLSKLGLPAGPAALEKFQKRIQIERLRHSGILRITAAGNDPAGAAEAANAVATSFIGHRRAQAVARTEEFLKALQEELRAVKGRLNVQTAERNKFLGIHQWEDFEMELRRCQQQVGDLKITLRSMEANAGQLAPLNDPSLQELARQMAEADARLNRERSRFKEGNPLVLQARQESESLQRLFQEKTGQRREALRKQLASEQRRLWLLLSKESQGHLLNTAVVQTQQRYQELLQRQSQAQLSLTLWNRPSDSFENLSILDRAVPPPERPRWPHILAVWAAAAALSLIALFGAPPLLDRWALHFKPEALDSIDRAFAIPAREPNGSIRH